ncbi:M50A family metalloprotease [Peptoniphilus indolicus ATCC 29427]|uniref:M50A family metalloprotease n=1 Tax=Peptoniphilus indolicus ATCC 29427 TaxID=997350 RepID=G4D5Q3_9FIRM|nr:site-2 protease family protein [Peptoniphilus indolicus]EGY78571.1 M50A family metalloprotease [Peptoniphilus indolicus ATCC 29427]
MSTLIGSIIVFMLVITLHELGHFTVAKLCNIKVNEFSIGMGPKLVSATKGETSYSLRLLPVGGYVAMEGEEENSNDPRAFNNVSVFKRMAVVIAGVVMNFILAVVAFLIVFSILGVRTNVVEDVIDNSPAKMAGMITGDRVVRIENVEIIDWDNLVSNISSKTDKVSIVVNRDGKEISFNVKPELKDGRYVIGITPKVQKNF